MPWGYRGWGTVRWAADSPGLAGVSYTPGEATLTITGQPLGGAYQFPADRVTWIGTEILHVGASAARVTNIVAEVLYNPNTNTAARVTWIGLEVLRDNVNGPTKAQVTWIGVEVLRSISAAVLSNDNFTSIIW